MFLHECLRPVYSAIADAGRLLPLDRIDDNTDSPLDLVYDRRRPAAGDDPAYDPLQELLREFEGVKSTALVKEDRSGWPVEERLARRIVEGDRAGLKPTWTRR